MYDEEFDLFDNTSFGGRKKKKKRSVTKRKPRTQTDKNVQLAGAAVSCASATYLASVIPPVTPPTAVAKAAAIGVAFVACGIAGKIVTDEATSDH